MRPLPLALCGLAAFGLAACDSADGPVAAPETATGTFDAALFPDADQLIVVSNQANDKDNDRAVRFRNPDALGGKAAFFRENRYDVTSFQSAKFERESSNFFGTFDIGTAESPQGRIAAFSRRGAPLGQSDGLVAPKGFDIADNGPFSSTVLVADFGDSSIKEFFADDLTAGANQSYIVPDSASVWDVAVVEEEGAFFAALTDGRVALYQLGNPVAQDTFAVAYADGTLAVNNHGIDYDIGLGLLLVSDVGSAAVADDGAVNVLFYEGPGSVGGIATADVTFAGSNTMLGNPVDLAGVFNSEEEGTSLDIFVAEKANGGGRILKFTLQDEGGMRNRAPDAMNNSIQGAESVDAFGPERIDGPRGPGDGGTINLREASPASWWTK